MKNWKKVLFGGLVIGGLCWASITDAATLRNKPGGKTKAEALWDAHQDNTETTGARTALTITPDDSDGAAVNMIAAQYVSVDVGTVVNGVTDYIVLPALAAVADGHTIIIICSSGGAFEMRTPSASAEEINSEDCDGTKEYLCTDGNILKVIKINATVGWMAHEFTPIGAVVTAVVPD